MVNSDKKIIESQTEETEVDEDGEEISIHGNWKSVWAGNDEEDEEEMT